MKPILISLSPNTQRDDVWAAFKLLSMPWRWRQEEPVVEATRQLVELFQLPVVLMSSGRAAIAAVLAARGIGQGDEVIVQAFTCVAVPAAVTWSGATPIYADIDPATYNLAVADVRAKINARTRAIIIQHTFGIPGPLDELLALAREHNLFVIEDCAHALGGQYQGKLLGTFGDAAILSFGRDKMLSSVFGGAVVSRHTELTTKIERMQDALPYPPAWWIAQQLLHPVLFAIIKPFYFVASIGKAILVAAQRVGLLSKAVSVDERSGGKPAHVAWRYSPVLAGLLLRQLQKLPNFTARRQEIAQEYASVLKVRCEASGTWLRFPLRVDKPKRLQRAARAQHILLGDWYEAAVVPAQANFAVLYYIPGSCQEAEKAAREVINLPTYPTMTADDVARVSAFVTSRLHS